MSTQHKWSVLKLGQRYHASVDTGDGGAFYSGESWPERAGAVEALSKALQMPVEEVEQKLQGDGIITLMDNIPDYKARIARKAEQLVQG